MKRLRALINKNEALMGNGIFDPETFEATLWMGDRISQENKSRHLSRGQKPQAVEIMVKAGFERGFETLSNYRIFKIFLPWKWLSIVWNFQSKSFVVSATRIGVVHFDVRLRDSISSGFVPKKNDFINHITLLLWLKNWMFYIVDRFFKRRRSFLQNCTHSSQRSLYFCSASHCFENFRHFSSVDRFFHRRQVFHRPIIVSKNTMNCKFRG